MENKKILCPCCNKEMTLSIDSWGKTPFHFHCSDCKINIGITYIPKIFNFLSNIKQNTWIEYYDNDIQVWYENEKMVINKEI